MAVTFLSLLLPLLFLLFLIPLLFLLLLSPQQEVLLMGHHGLLTAADSIAVAFDLHYYFEQVNWNFQTLQSTVRETISHLMLP